MAKSKVDKAIEAINELDLSQLEEVLTYGMKRGIDLADEALEANKAQDKALNALKSKLTVVKDEK